MGDLISRLTDVARSMWRRRWIGLAMAWLLGIAGGLALTQFTDRYEAVARVYVDTKTVLRPLMKDLAVEPDIDQAVAMLARTLITRPNVELLIRKAQLDIRAGARLDREKLILELTRNIKLSSVGHDNVYDFSYQDPDGDRARLIVSTLVALFLEADVGIKQRDAESARNFIDDQIKSYEVRLTESEARLKDFKLRNLGVTSGMNGGGDYFARMSALTDEINRLTIELRAAEQSRDALKRELGGEVAPLLPESPSQDPTIASPEFDARLDVQRKQLDELLRRYTDLHPDVVATRRLIARLEEQKQLDIEARRKAMVGRARPSGLSDTLAQRMKMSAAEAEANVAALRSRLGDTQAKLAQLRSAATRIPQVEAELAQLNRDYDVIRRNYEALVARREKALISEDVDATRPAQFRIIDPPHAKKQPVFPSKRALAPLVLILALAGGVAASFLSVRLAPTVDNASLLRSITQRPVLGSISVLSNEATNFASKRATMLFGSALGGLLLTGAVWLGWLMSVTRIP